ncbi:MAG: hypothetical protein GY804_00135 [Alphaproteobacteria bacterium]|nr:hypothetical protein [Alphaproteobacteria bacterium]
MKNLKICLTLCCMLSLISCSDDDSSSNVNNDDNQIIFDLSGLTAIPSTTEIEGRWFAECIAQSNNEKSRIDFVEFDKLGYMRSGSYNYLGEDCTGELISVSGGGFGQKITSTNTFAEYPEVLQLKYETKLNLFSLPENVDGYMATKTFTLVDGILTKYHSAYNDKYLIEDIYIIYTTKEDVQELVQTEFTDKLWLNECENHTSGEGAHSSSQFALKLFSNGYYAPPQHSKINFEGYDCNPLNLTGSVGAYPFSFESSQLLGTGFTYQPLSTDFFLIYDGASLLLGEDYLFHDVDNYTTEIEYTLYEPAL